MSTEPQGGTAVAVMSPAREQAQIERQRAMAEVTFGQQISPFSNGDAFKLACAIAERLCQSSMIPEAYRGHPENVMVAMDYGSRFGIGCVQMMQNMDVVKGRPGLRGTFLAALINKSPLFSRLSYEWRGTDKPGAKPSPDFGCRAYATEKATGEVLYGTWIDWRMVEGEGWDKNTKWTHMREQMFQYRAAAFWSRVHASDVTLGMHESEELFDMHDPRIVSHVEKQPAPDRGEFIERLAARAVDAEPSPSSDAGAEGAPPPAADPAPASTPSTPSRGRRRVIE